MSKDFLKAMFNNLDDLYDGSDEEVHAELEAMGIDVDVAKKSFMETLQKAKESQYYRKRSQELRGQTLQKEIVKWEGLKQSKTILSAGIFDRNLCTLYFNDNNHDGICSMCPLAKVDRCCLEDNSSYNKYMDLIRKPIDKLHEVGDYSLEWLDGEIEPSILKEIESCIDQMLKNLRLALEQKGK